MKMVANGTGLKCPTIDPHHPWVQRTICFLVFSQVHLLDLSGPAQVFYEASNLGGVQYRITYCGTRPKVLAEQGLTLGDLKPLSSQRLQRGDFIFVPGIDFKSFTEGRIDDEIEKIGPWLKMHLQNGVNIASVCSGALILGAVGLLDQKRCTSHWKCIQYMKEKFPLASVQTERLYVRDESIYTSAGMTSGIDMALYILESEHGPILPARVAREIVVYVRRNNVDTHQPIYLDYRTHFNPSIHLVQDYIISSPSKNPGLEELATVGNTSVRNLTRAFKKATGHTIIEFKNAIKVELARTLVHNKAYTMEMISSLCGFQSVRHFRRIWTKHIGTSLHAYRAENKRE